MSWSLELTNGDLGYGAGGMQTVTGGDKLVQDLSCCILEPMGTDFINPDFGSVIDGGVDSEGTVYESLIGQTNNSAASTLVESEIQRICQDYQTFQAERNQNDLSDYGVSTISVGEALLSIDAINIQQVETMLMAGVILNTGSGQQIVSVGLGTS